MAKMNKPENSDREFTPCPEGSQQAVCVDFVDCGYREVVFQGESKGWQPMVKLVFATETLREDGKPYLVFDRQMKFSFHEKAALTKRLLAWLGKKQFEELLESGADTDALIGINAIINVEHNEYNGKMYANIGSIGPIMKGMEPLGVGDYERMQDRDNWEERKPVPSAFDGASEANRIIQAREANGEAARAAETNYKPSPAYPTNEYSSQPNAVTPPTAVVTSPEATQKLVSQAMALFGGNAVTELETRAQHLFKTSWMRLTDDQAARFGSELRSVKPVESVAAKMDALEPTAVEMSAPFDMFADQGEPGYRPDGHPDRNEDGNGQGELIATGTQPTSYSPS